MSGGTHLFVRDTSTVAVARNVAKPHKHFLRRVDPVINYEHDESELLPPSKKTGRIDVDLADAKEVSVASKTKKVVTKYEATKRPSVRFKGELAVSDGPDEPVWLVDAALATSDAKPTESASADSNVFHAPEGVAEVEVGEAEEEVVEKEGDTSVETLVPEVQGGAHKTKVPIHVYVSDQTTPVVDTADTTKLSYAAVAEARHERPRRGIALAVRSLDAAHADIIPTGPDPETPPSPVSITYVLTAGTVALLFAIVIVTAMLGTESEVAGTSTTIATDYNFSLASLFDIVRTHIAALLIHSS